MCRGLAVWSVGCSSSFHRWAMCGLTLMNLSGPQPSQQMQGVRNRRNLCDATILWFSHSFHVKLRKNNFALDKNDSYTYDTSKNPGLCLQYNLCLLREYPIRCILVQSWSTDSWESASGPVLAPPLTVWLWAGYLTSLYLSFVICYLWHLTFWWTVVFLIWKNRCALNTLQSSGPPGHVNKYYSVFTMCSRHVNRL